MNPSSLDTASISLDELPTMPAASVRIVGLCDDVNVDIGQLAEAISLDPALSARILRMANSAAFSRGNEVTTIERSMMLMGIKAVKLTALGFVVSSALSDRIEVDPETMRQVWRDCLVEAVACRELSELARLRAAPEAFLAGMFDGMGKLLGVLTRPETFGPLIAENPWPDADAERSCLGLTRTELVSAALQSWGVPVLYSRVIEEADRGIEDFDGAEVARLGATLVLARQATRLLTGHADADASADRARAALQLNSDAVDMIAVDLARHVADLARALDLDLGAEVDYPALLNQARNQIVQTSLAMAQESIEQSDQISSLENQRESLHHEATTDRLTGLPNRAAFDDFLERLVADRVDGRTVSGGLGLAMIDIDFFKKFNDTYGHRAGDDVLSAVGQRLAEVTREGEMIARFGGEEFVMLMPIVEDGEKLGLAAERIRREIGALQVTSGGLLLNVTVSIGAVASAALVSTEGGAALTEAADRLLYQAKNAGRNCTRVEFLGVSSSAN